MADRESAPAGGVRLTTDRLEISALTASDVEAFVTYRRDPRVARFQSWDVDYDASQAQRLVAEQSSGSLRTGRWLQLGLRELATGVLVGDTAVYTRPNQPDSYGLGVTLASAHQGRGLATEACERILDHLFTRVHAHRVEATCDVRNSASSHLLRRLGMRHESRLVDADWCKGEWTTVDTYAVLSSERLSASLPPDTSRSLAVADPDPQERSLRSVSFLGIHTASFEAMKDLYADAYGARLIRDTEEVAWFRLTDGAEVHVYAASDTYHRFFGTAPVVGLLVDDFVDTELRLTRAGVEWLTAPDTADGRTWRHYRAPDGNVYEVMGPSDLRGS